MTRIAPPKLNVVSSPRPVGGRAQAPARRVVVTPGVAKAVLTSPTTKNEIQFHVSPSESHRAILESIENARSSYYIETFIWHNDEAGNEIADALIAKKREAEKRGQRFDAKVLIDWLGLRNGSGGSDDTAIVEKLRQGGIEVLEFSPKYLDTKSKSMITPITHRKLYIADGTQFITGGRNIGNEYLKPTYQLGNGHEEASWHDLLYTVRGNETGRILTEFFKNWERAGGKKPARMPVVIPALGGSARVESVLTNPHTGVYELRAAHQKAIRKATKEIVAIYPYFSDDQLVKDLIAAKKARPDLSVRVIMPSNKEASHEGTIYSMLNKETARQLLAAGIEVRMFDGGEVQRFSHLKAMLFDNQLLSIGSANGDARTFNANHELNTLIADPKAVSEFRSKVIEKDWAAAEPITLEELAGQSWWDKFKQKVLEVFDFLL